MSDTGAPAPQREGTARWPALRVILKNPWVVAVAAVAVLGAAIFTVVGGGDPAGPVGSFVSAQPGAPKADNTKPKASSFPVRASDDLARVCEGWFYPDSPRYDGRAPHQISIAVRDQSSDTTHRVKAALDVPPTLRAKTREAWMPSQPAKSQLVACVTLDKTGTQVKKCDQVALKRGVFTVAVYEVATHRELVKREVTGDVVRCPNVIPLGTGDTIATTVSDRTLYRLLDDYVTG
ncbi:hypothetical protein KOI35_04370 [Actinoplanes bogorensis]|uniref:Uncharacterized protein n=1 Tax=Paractinoplanes bogorensis TaxID=1610840 RepID=A0ABS5YGZ4_9ACTN|nr:hypothetical protein [Actinoplanes bogorensis]MBU2662735.1 hypothetical protein [Actinoplanes bogorensis]